jgi:hypothetical protein
MVEVTGLSRNACSKGSLSNVRTKKARFGREVLLDPENDRAWRLPCAKEFRGAAVQTTFPGAIKSDRPKSAAIRKAAIANESD